MNHVILGIETSCDETGAAIYTTNDGIISSSLYSQIDLHKIYGGVVPEVASRSQLEKITPIVIQALNDANMTFNDVTTIAVTSKPGLAGSLLVGVCFAKMAALGGNKKLIGVNHLEGHAFSAFLENDIPFPHICLTASGGHTSLYYMRGFGDYQTIGQTLDDAAGEAFDKIAKLMHLGYPGGPIIEKYAKEAGFKDYFNYTRSSAQGLDFSFSGLKTAILYDLVNRGAYDLKNKQFLATGDHELITHVASSLLVCMGDIFIKKLTLALKHYPDVKTISFVGGVACNSYLTSTLGQWAKTRNIQFFCPSRKYCTDNAGMIAFVGHYKAQQGLFSDINLDIF